MGKRTCPRICLAVSSIPYPSTRNASSQLLLYFLFTYLLSTSLHLLLPSVLLCCHSSLLQIPLLVLILPYYPPSPPPAASRGGAACAARPAPYARGDVGAVGREPAPPRWRSDREDDRCFHSRRSGQTC